MLGLPLRADQKRETCQHGRPKIDNGTKRNKNNNKVIYVSLGGLQIVSITDGVSHAFVALEALPPHPL